MLRRIAHTTDFSDNSASAFLHALRMAVTARCRLDILHVHNPAEPESWATFPHVREPLIRWGLLDAQAAPDDIEARLGVHVAKIEIGHRDPGGGLATFFREHRPDLLVVATHGREGVNRWLHGSVTEDLVARSRVPTLMIGPESTGIVDAITGRMSIDRILLPVTTRPDPAGALHAFSALLQPLGIAPHAFHIVEIGDDVPDLLSPGGAPVKVHHRQGPVVETIIAEAETEVVDLIAMPTSGRHGFLDALRGSTTSRVLAHAQCPVLTLPLGT